MDVYDGSNWLWTAGHLGIVHAMQAMASEAWEAIIHGLGSCGPAMIPNEHIDGRGVVHVPWFTTGVGAWLYAIHAAFAWVDEHATHLASALPLEADRATFERVRGGGGVLLSGAVERGCLRELVAVAPRDMEWCFSLPANVSEAVVVHGDQIKRSQGRVLYRCTLKGEATTPLVSSH